MDPDAAQFLSQQYAHIRTNEELNIAETYNIQDAQFWLQDRRLSVSTLLAQSELREIHRQMYGQVWTWAGKYRINEVNIGDCPPSEVPTRLEQVLGNIEYQVNEGSLEPLLACVKYHQGITQIHPFVNGNGRHARLTTAKLGETLGLAADEFTWGSRTIPDVSKRRHTYLESLRRADGGELEPLAAIIMN